MVDAPVVVEPGADATPAAGAARLRRASTARARWPRGAVEAIHRLNELIVEQLGVSRSGVWAVAGDGRSATCIDLYERDGARHRRAGVRHAADDPVFHRCLDERGVVAAPSSDADIEPAPDGVTAVMAVGLRREGRLAAYVCAEQTGASRTWTMEEQRFMKSMIDVVREVLATAGPEAAAAHAPALLQRLPAVAYRGSRIGERWTLTFVSEGALQVLGRAAADLVGRPIEALRELLSTAPPALPEEGEFENGYGRHEPAAQPRRLTEKGRVGVDAASGEPVVEAIVADITASTADASGGVAAPAAVPPVASELLSQVSHELRTPLNAILGFAQLLERDPAVMATPSGEYLAQIQRAGRHLMEVINETLDLSRLEAGAVELEIQPVALDTMITQCLPMIENQAAQAQVSVVAAMPPAALRVRADPRRLSQALVNLLSNAVKYNRRGGRVTIDCVADAASVRLRVADTGIGVAESQIGALFQPFNRLGMEQSAIEGVGLGLVITRRLLEAMGGRIEVASQHGVGSTFSIVLPCATP